MREQTMDINASGYALKQFTLAGVSLLGMLLGWISEADAYALLKWVSTLVSIAAGCMVFYNNYKQSKRKP